MSYYEEKLFNSWFSRVREQILQDELDYAVDRHEEIKIIRVFLRDAFYQGYLTGEANARED